MEVAKPQNVTRVGSVGGWWLAAGGLVVAGQCPVAGRKSGSNYALPKVFFGGPRIY